MLNRLHQLLKSGILNIIDAFYPLFKKLMPLQTFRYAACGGGNTAFNIFIYFIAYNFILKKEILHLPFVAISPHIAAFIIAFFITFPIGYYLNMFVVFEGSYLKKRIQLFRYFLVVIICILLNYVFLKLFVEGLGWNATFAKIVTTFFVVIFSYTSQKNFTFKTKTD